MIKFSRTRKTIGFVDSVLNKIEKYANEKCYGNFSQAVNELIDKALDEKK